jgi:hypothetical protein
MRTVVLALLGVLALATPAIVARLEGDKGDLDVWLAMQPEDRLAALEAIGISGLLLLAEAVVV